MAKKALPWFWEPRGVWCVKINGYRHVLGEHPDNAPKPRKGKRGWNVPDEIMDEFNKVRNGQPKATNTVASILDDFITWSYEHRSKITTNRYKEFCQDFINFKYGDVKLGEIAVSHLHSGHATEWLSCHEKWGPTTKANALTAIQRGFNWAVKNRGLDRNPIKGMEKPQAKSRTETITPEEFENLLPHCLPGFRDLLILSYDSGARPFEIKELESRHIQIDKSRAVIPAGEAKGRKHTRIVYFPTERSMEIIIRLMNERPEGKLLLNAKGNPWTGNAVKNAFARLEKKIGKRITHYSLRHSRITDWLVSGCDSHVASKLAGHQDSRMLDRVYSHVQDDYEYMLENAKKRTNQEKDS